MMVKICTSDAVFLSLLIIRCNGVIKEGILKYLIGIDLAPFCFYIADESGDLAMMLIIISEVESDTGSVKSFPEEIQCSRAEVDYKWVTYENSLQFQ